MAFSSRETFLDLGKNLVARDRLDSAGTQIREPAPRNQGPRLINFSYPNQYEMLSFHIVSNVRISLRRHPCRR